MVESLGGERTEACGAIRLYFFLFLAVVIVVEDARRLQAGEICQAKTCIPRIELIGVIDEVFLISGTSRAQYLVRVGVVRVNR
jgi:hypothetical protein